MNLLPEGVLGGAGVVVGIRPEHVRITPGGAHLATVRLVEPLGHETLVTCELVGADGHRRSPRRPARARRA